MSTVVFRSDSPYVPRATEPRRTSSLVLVRDADPTLRILVLSSADPKIVESNYISELTRVLADLGHHVDVASGMPYPELDTRVGLIELAPLRNVDLPFVPSGLKAAVRRLLGPYLYSLRLGGLMHRLGAHYDLAIDNGTLEPAALKLKRLGLPVVSIVHDPGLLSDHHRKRVAVAIDGLIVAAPGALETLAERYRVERRKLVVIPRGPEGRGERVARLIDKLYSELTR